MAQLESPVNVHRWARVRDPEKSPKVDFFFPRFSSEIFRATYASYDAESCLICRKNNQKQPAPIPASSCRHHFLSFFLPTPLSFERTVDSGGVRGIWIYMPPKGPHQQGGSDHPFGVCQVMSRHDGPVGKAPCYKHRWVRVRDPEKSPKADFFFPEVFKRNLSRNIRLT